MEYIEIKMDWLQSRAAGKPDNDEGEWASLTAQP